MTIITESFGPCNVVLIRRLVQLLLLRRRQLYQVREDRLAELDRLLAHTRGRCLHCGYRSPTEVCSPCIAGQWPPFNRYFRTQGQAYTAWFALNAILGMRAIDEGFARAQGLLQDPTASDESIQQALARLQELTQQDIRPFPSNDPDMVRRLRQVSLVDYASRHTALRPAGPGRWRGPCPLHIDPGRSFRVYAGPWRWKCYACDSSGDIFDLASALKSNGGPDGSA